jgi:hypothetical protein
VLDPHEWEEHYLLVMLTGGGSPYLLDHMSQEEFLTWCLGQVGFAACYNVMPLTQEAFEVYENIAQQKGRLLRGESA